MNICPRRLRDPGVPKESVTLNSLRVSNRGKVCNGKKVKKGNKGKEKEQTVARRPSSVNNRPTSYNRAPENTSPPGTHQTVRTLQQATPGLLPRFLTRILPKPSPANASQQTPMQPQLNEPTYSQAQPVPSDTNMSFNGTPSDFFIGSMKPTMGYFARPQQGDQMSSNGYPMYYAYHGMSPEHQQSGITQNSFSLLEAPGIVPPMPPSYDRPPIFLPRPLDFVCLMTGEIEDHNAVCLHHPELGASFITPGVVDLLRYLRQPLPASHAGRTYNTPFGCTATPEYFIRVNLKPLVPGKQSKAVGILVMPFEMPYGSIVAGNPLLARLFG